MWVDTTLSEKELTAVPLVSASPQWKPRVSTASEARAGRLERSALLTVKKETASFHSRYIILYLIGALLSGVLYQIASLHSSPYISVLVKAQVTLLAQPVATQFGARFLTAFFALSLVALSGFSLSGKIVSALVFFLKGLGSGCILVAVYNAGDMHALLEYLLTWQISEALQILLLLLLAARANKLASAIYACSFLQNPAEKAQIKDITHQLLIAYLLLSGLSAAILAAFTALSPAVGSLLSHVLAAGSGGI